MFQRQLAAKPDPDLIDLDLEGSENTKSLREESRLLESDL